jgi:hypothetical protein
MMYLADLQLSCDPHTEIGKAKWEALETAFQGIADMQSVEAVQGEWLDEGMPKCSICGKWIDVLQGTANLNYCPNCGAKMTKGGED